MPIYEYRCIHCDLVFMEMNTVAKCKEPSMCPTCFSEAPRILSATPTSFKHMDKHPNKRKK